MERRPIVKEGKQISSECIEKFWRYLVKERKCVSNCKSEMLVFEGVNILRCLMCGKRYYKEFPERPHNSEVCMICGCFFIKDNNTTHYNICADCIKTHTIKNNKRVGKVLRESVVRNTHFT